MLRFVITARSVILGGMCVAFLLFGMACGNNRSGLSISPVENVRPNSQPGASCATRGAATTVSEFAGHTHGSTFIPPEDIVAGLQKTYSTPITNGHWHGFIITAAQFQDLKDNVPVVTYTYADSSGHAHQVSIYCY